MAAACMSGGSWATQDLYCLSGESSRNPTRLQPVCLEYPGQPQIYSVSPECVASVRGWESTSPPCEW